MSKKEFALTNMLPAGKEFLDLLPPLRKPPRKYQIITIVVTIWCFMMGIYCLLTSNWLGVLLNVGLIVINVVPAYYRLGWVSKLWKNYEYLQASYKILVTPLITEDKDKNWRMISFWAILPKEDIPEYKD